MADDSTDGLYVHQKAWCLREEGQDDDGGQDLGQDFPVHRNSDGSSIAHLLVVVLGVILLRATFLA